jgi:hypothetical protein
MPPGQGQQDSCKNACLNIFVMDEKDPNGHNEFVNEQDVWATGGVRIMTIIYRKTKALWQSLCSPTSALEMNEC